MTNKIQSLKVIIWNAQSIKPKFIEFIDFIKSNNIDICLITETWLLDTQSIYDSEFAIYRLDRPGKANPRGTLIGHGGVCILIRKALKHKLLPSFNLKIIEAVGVKIYSCLGDITFVSAYFPGSSDTIKLDLFKKDIQILTNITDPFFIGCDLNAKHQVWNCFRGNKTGKILHSESAIKNFNILHPSDPTHYSKKSKHPSTLDLLLSNHYELVSNIQTLNKLSSDHLPVKFTVNMLEYQTTEESNVILDYRNANWLAYKRIINNKIDFSSNSNLNKLSTKDDIDTALDYLSKTVKDSANIVIPKLPRFKVNNNTLILPEELKQLIKTKNYLRRQWQRTREPALKNIVNHLIKTVINELNNLRNERFSKFISSIATTISHKKRLFHLTRLLDKRKQKIPALEDVDAQNNSITLITNLEKSNAFANHFAQIHRQNDNINPKFASDIKEIVTNSIDSIQNADHSLTGRELVKPREISTIIVSLKNSKSPGMDGITNQLIKHLPRKAIVYLTYLYNACFRINYFPVKWKQATVVPISKPQKDKRKVENYRPISLLNGLSKIFEKIILNRLIQFSENNLIIPNEQFGFRQGHSTNHQLLRICNIVKHQLNMRKSTALVLFDIEKAFDKVWHEGLIYKMIQYNFPLYLIRIIKNFLKDRYFNVSINNEMSQPKPIFYGVPQGAVLSPFLYNLYTSDIKLEISNDVHFAQYADDTAIYSASSDVNIIMNNIQMTIDKLSIYYSRWGIKINPLKTQAIFFSRKRATRNLPSANSLQIDGTSVKWSNNNVKYLGMILDKRLTYKDHINYSIDKCNKITRLLYSLLHRKSKLSTINKRLIYLLILRSVLLYASPIWFDSAKTHIKKIQIAQNKCLKMIYTKPKFFSTKRLHKISKVPLVMEQITKTRNKFKNNLSLIQNEIINNLLV